MAKKARIWNPNGKPVNANEVYKKAPFFAISTIAMPQ